MKVLHFAETLPGGPATYLNELVPIQNKQYDSVHVLCPDGQVKHISKSGAEIHTFSSNGRNLGSLKNAFISLKNLLVMNHYDVLHLHSSLAGLIGRIVTVPKHTRVIYCPHGFSFSAESHGGIFRFCYKWVEKFLSFRTHAIIAISMAEYSRAMAAQIKRQKIHLVRNGIARTDWKPITPHQGPMRIIFVGRFDRQKGLDLLFEALEDLPRDIYTLTLIGGAIVQSGKELKVPSHINNLGWLPSEQVSHHISDSDIVVMPSRWEGLPLVALEAMRAGRPIIGTDIGGLNECIQDGVTGIIVQPENARSLSEAIASVKHLDLRSMGENGRKFFEDNFDSQRMFEELDYVYKSSSKKGER